MFESFVETWAQATVRDIVLTLVGLVVLAVVLTLLGRRNRLRTLSEEHLYVAGVIGVGLALLAIGLYNRYWAG
jgi:hypothetical protein